MHLEGGVCIIGRVLMPLRQPQSPPPLSPRDPQKAESSSSYLCLYTNLPSHPLNKSASSSLGSLRISGKVQSFSANSLYSDIPLGLGKGFGCGHVAQSQRKLCGVFRMGDRGGEGPRSLS